MGTCYSNPDGERHGMTLCGSFREIQSPKEQQKQKKQKGVAQEFAENDSYQIDEDVLYVSEVWEKIEESMLLEVQAEYAEYYSAWVERQIRERPIYDNLNVSLPHDIRQM